MKLLVTGGAGFIGSNFVRFMLENNPEVEIINLDLLTYAGNLDNIKFIDGARHAFVKGDICDKRLVLDLMEQADAVVHFAAESHVDNSIRDSEPFVRTNVLGTQTLLEAARKSDVKKFIHISTDEVYGVSDGKLKEDAQLKPRNPYSATKAAADFLAQSYYITYGLPVVITRAANNFGPCQHSEKLLPKVIMNALQNKKIPVYGQGLQRRNWLYVDDNCAAVNFLLERGKAGEAYNITDENELPNIELVKKVLNILGRPESLIEFVHDRPGHDFVYRIDAAKIRALGWQPKHGFEASLLKTAGWYTDALKN